MWTLLCFRKIKLLDKYFLSDTFSGRIFVTTVSSYATFFLYIIEFSRPMHSFSMHKMFFLGKTFSQLRPANHHPLEYTDSPFPPSRHRLLFLLWVLPLIFPESCLQQSKELLSQSSSIASTGQGFPEKQDQWALCLWLCHLSLSPVSTHLPTHAPLFPSLSYFPSPSFSLFHPSTFIIRNWLTWFWSLGSPKSAPWASRLGAQEGQWCCSSPGMVRWRSCLVGQLIFCSVL